MAQRIVARSRPDLWVPGGAYGWLLVTLASRLILNSWPNAGVWYAGEKGIPSTIGWTTINVPVTGSGDETAIIQAAIDAAGPYTVLSFPAGEFFYTSLNCYGKSFLVLRGVGPTLTTLTCLGSSSIPAIDFLGAASLTGPYTISSGATKGSNVVVVSSVTNLSIGDVITIFPDIPAGFCSDYGTVFPGVTRLPIESTYPPNPGLTVEVPETNTYFGWSYNTVSYPRTGAGSNCQWYEGFGQLVEITDIVGNAVYFKEPLYYDYSAYSPRLKKYGPFLSTSGIESMRIRFQTGSTAGGHLIRFMFAKNCWVRNCEVYNTHLHGIYIRYSKSCEVTNNYLHHGTYYIGDTCYLISMADYNSDHLVYNNIVRHGRHHIVFEGGGQGCVISYNHSLDTCGDVTGWMFSDIGLHGRHPYMNLWEGNYAGGLEFDSIHGSSSHNTALRNALSARGVNDFSPGGYTAAQIALKIAKDSIYHILVGNVLGYPGCAADGYEFERYEAGLYRKYMQYIGASGDTAGPVSLNPDSFEFPWSMPKTTGIFHGNYDYVGNAARWDPSISGRDIPPSLYLTSKPAWFGALDWPAIGPDVDGFRKDIPAKKRWDAYVISNNPVDLFA